MWLALLSLLAGATLVLAFAPFNAYVLGFVSPAILLWTALRSTTLQAAYRGFFFGLGYFGCGISWIYISLHRFGNAPAPLAVLITGLIVMILAVYPALLSYLCCRLSRYRSLAITCLCLFPALWALIEGLRAEWITGFPWLLLGYSQLPTPLHALAPLFGIYGTSLAVALVSGSLVLLASSIGPTLSLYGRLGAIVFIVLLFLSSWLLGKIHWTQALTGDTLTVSLVQGNVPQSIKWQPQRLLHILNLYSDLTQPLWEKSHLIIWPEAAVPTAPNNVPDYYEQWDRLARQHQTYLLLGSPIYDQSSKAWYNGLRLLGDNTTPLTRYLKRRLVPFGEYTPFPSVFGPLMQQLQIPLSNFSHGPNHQAILRVGRITMTPLICYEIAFSSEVLQHVGHTQLLVNLSDDSWFGRSIAPYQQVQMAQFRALETGRPLLSSSNTGVTAIINPKGTLVASLPMDQRRVLSGTVTPMQGQTPLMRWRYYPVCFVVIALLLIGLFLRKTKRL